MNKLIYTFLTIAALATMSSCNTKKQESKECPPGCTKCETSVAVKTETKECPSGCTKCESGTSSATNNKIDNSKVSVVYFHATRRCATCEAVEEVTKETLAEHYKEVPFHSINREEEKELAKKYKVEWQTLMVMKGDKMVNITNEAFMNARTKPEKLKALLQSTIDSML